jgi:replicative DNA helicase
MITSIRDGGDLLRQPPHNVQAEQALLGAIFLKNDIYYKVSEFLGPEHFSYAINSRIYTVIGRIIDSGQRATPVTIRGYFEADNALKDIGGAQYLGQLASCAPTLINAEDYARLVLDLAQRRQLMASCEEMSEAAYQVDIDKPAITIIGEFEQRLAQIAEGASAIRTATTPLDGSNSAVAFAERAYRGEMMFIPTGLKALDRILGGFMPGNLELIAARPGIGKTALALTIAAHVASRELPVLYFSLEQTAMQLHQRLISSVTGIPVQRQMMNNELTMLEMRKIIAAGERTAKIPLHIDDNGGLSVAQICHRARRAYRRQQLRLVVIDHLQLVAPNTKKEARRLELDEISGNLKILAKELNIPVLALSQLNRGVEGREDKRPTLPDLRDSGGLEQDSDRVMFVYREEYYAQRVKIERREGEDNERLDARICAHNDRLEACRGRADIFVAKNRHGESNIRADLAWDANRMRFYDLATDLEVR